MDIVFIGDSLTFGYGVTKEVSWVDLLTKNLNLEYINKGTNGDTTTGILSRFYKDVLLSKPKYCFILCGTNDFLLDRSLNSIYENILLMINDCIANNVKPVILTPPYICEKKALIHWSSYPDYATINEHLSVLNNKL